MPADGALDTPLRNDGFRERGKQVSRLETFVDAAFAFAVTLLVISSSGIPTSAAELTRALAGVPAFAASFLLVALIWRAHEVWSRRYGLCDGRRGYQLSLLLVFFVLVFVYPLKMLFASLFAWMTRGMLPSAFVIRSWEDLRLVFAVYGAAYATLSWTLAALYGEAWRRRDELELGAIERATTRGALLSWRVHAATAGVSALLALVMPVPRWPLVAGLPGLVYVTLFVSMPLVRRATARTV